ncbi:hypothetical protein H5410_019725 [Solanum commersonii]|uniref:Uncharacterized protein n=1 Tax=Solanum commersonii TaxID=4109 RepID=A0A9J5ZAD5_SOLCO|nr:hypothetical protein H5410_019725 [Solanum commersonii]
MSLSIDPTTKDHQSQSNLHNSLLPFEEERRRINNHIDDFLNGLNKIKNEEEESIASKLDDIEKLRMELRFLRTFVLFGNSSLDDYEYKKINPSEIQHGRSRPAAAGRDEKLFEFGDNNRGENV